MLRCSAQRALLFTTDQRKKGQKCMHTVAWNEIDRKNTLTFPQFIYSTAVSRKKKYTKSPCVNELMKFGAERGELEINIDVIFIWNWIRIASAVR